MPNWNRWSLLPFALAATACAVPLLLAHSPALAFALQRGFSLVCHQQADRSFVLFGGTIAVCARCLGIYLGVALGLLLRVPRQIAWRVFIAALTVNLTDWLAELSGLHGNWMFARLALGIALGATAAMLVTAGSAGNKIPTQAKEAYVRHPAGDKTSPQTYAHGFQAGGPKICSITQNIAC